MSHPPRASTPFTPSKLEPLLRPLHAFLSAESAGGVVLMVAAVAAVMWANSPWADAYHDLWRTKVSIGVARWSLSVSLEHCVNDGLMVLFFLLVGLEIKRELMFGELASFSRASLPIAAALGGMIVPALIYAILNARSSGSKGWAIPTATDIAFAVGILALVGRAVPTSLKVFLLAVAIVDDLGAVLVIALFYTANIFTPALAVAGFILLILAVLNLLNVHRPFPYMLLGLGLWAAILLSGVHATIAGVLLAFTIPASRRIEELPYVDYARGMLDQFERDATQVPDRITENQSHAIKAMEEAAQAVQTPLARVEHALLFPVTFLVVPIFALANAGVDLKPGSGGSSMTSSVTWGVLLGLLVGKPVGVLTASWGAIAWGLAALPEAVTWRLMVGVSALCGIGFTMSLFVGNLAFPQHPEHAIATKVGILCASVLSGVAGAVIIGWPQRRRSLPTQSR